LTDIDAIKEEVKKARAISVARKLESQGDWFAFWMGRQDAYSEVLALIEGDEKARAFHTIATPENLKLAKEKGFL